MHDCIDIRGVPKGEGNKGGRAPKDLIEFAEGQLLFGGGGGAKNSRGGAKNSRHTIRIFAPLPSDFFLTYSPG